MRTCDTCGHVSACGLLGGCAHASLTMWVHVHFYCAMYNERWALISSCDICVPACHCICGYTLTIPPPPHTLPYYPRTQYLPRPLCQTTIIGGGLPSLDHGRVAVKPTIGARQRRLCLSSCSPLPAPCSANTPHLALHTHNTTPLHATTLHSHLPLYLHPPHTHTFQHIIFCKYTAPRLCVGLFVKGAQSMGLLDVHTTHAINTRKHPTHIRLGKVPLVSLFRSTLQTV